MSKGFLITGKLDDGSRTFLTELKREGSSRIEALAHVPACHVTMISEREQGALRVDKIHACIVDLANELRNRGLLWDKQLERRRHLYEDFVWFLLWKWDLAQLDDVYIAVLGHQNRFNLRW